jgi:dihydrofolate synthase/folylpolyglutamate synthase
LGETSQGTGRENGTMDQNSEPATEKRPLSEEMGNGRPFPRLDASEVLAFWFGRINYEHRTPEATDLKLERMHALLDRLGNPHHALRIVHVAGSKGKGSTAAMIASILCRAGYRAGLFTSPHLCRVEERIQVDGTPISGPELTALLNEVYPAVRWLDAHGGAGAVTFFEVATALGFLHFARRAVDVAVVEVGLGGRFDSTNVCQPVVSLITSISFDHTKLLGDRLSQIAMEKAGIVKPGRPVLSGARLPDPRRVISRICRERGAPLRELGVAIHYRHEPGVITTEGQRLPRVAIITDRRTWPKMELGLLGDHQAANAALAVAAVETLAEAGLPVPDAAVAAGLAGVRWPARLEVLGRRPLVVLDCAHNVASAEALVDTLRASFPESAGGRGKRFLVFAGSNDKDLAGMFRVLGPEFAHLFLTRFSDNARAVSPDQLAAILRQVSGTPFSTHATPAEAWHAARALAGPDDLVGITGSVFLAGELRPVLDREGDPG